MTDEERSEALNAAAGNLKKIAASRGALSGVFYFAGDAKAKNCGLIVNLQKRDPKGAKTAAAGKKLRKSIQGAKFARGTVEFGTKLTFVIHQGTAAAVLIKKSFTTVLSKEYGLRPLTRAVIRAADGTEELSATEAEETANAEGAEDGAGQGQEQAPAMSAEEQAELAQLLAELESEGPEISNATKALNASFLSADSALEETEALMEEALGQAANIEERLGNIDREKDPDAWASAYAELNEARFKLAELNFSGPEPFPAPGQLLSEADRAIMGAAVGESLLALRRQLLSFSGEIDSQAKERSPQELDALAGTYHQMVGNYQRQLVALSEEL